MDVVTTNTLSYFFHITGMVSMCAGCNMFQPWSALVIGFIAGFMYIGLHKAMLKCLLDDPLDAVAVHLGGGTLGRYSKTSPNAITPFLLTRSSIQHNLVSGHEYSHNTSTVLTPTRF